MQNLYQYRIENFDSIFCYLIYAVFKSYDIMFLPRIVSGYLKTHFDITGIMLNTL
jgi:hypothetical protein